jgi:hypothetical protein
MAERSRAPASLDRGRKDLCPSAGRLLLFARFPFARCLAANFLLGHLRARSAGFGQSDCDRLLTALHGLARTAALQFSALAFMHYAFDFLRGFLAVASCHDWLPLRLVRTWNASCLSVFLSTARCVQLLREPRRTSVPVFLAEFDGRKCHQRTEPEYSRSGAAAQRREEETCLSELGCIFQFFAAPLREYFLVSSVPKRQTNTMDG